MQNATPRYGLISAKKTIDGYIVMEGDIFLAIEKRDGGEWWLTAPGDNTLNLDPSHPAYGFEYGIAGRKADLIMLATFLLWPTSPLTADLAWAGCWT